MISNMFIATLICATLISTGAAIAADAPVENPSPASVTTQDPIKLLKNVTDSVLKALRINSAELDSKPNKIYEVVDKLVLPYVDFNEMAIWVAGRSVWGKAPEKLREDFVSEFKVLVVRTYATALRSYSNESVYFAPQKINTEKDRIQITSTIVRTSKENINLNYRMIKHGDSWFVYDVIIEGVSILQGFQSQFSNDIRQKGLEHVITQIKQHNKKGTT